ncbi:uncharacterized protein K02A2.6-like [Ostrea edulis]|uniref:uncharacterized protein K02A2.6-like n=1 Tax=Ostrea edulis TaxID=37623 RepID=UPI0024AFEE73|nr:uncharacterized protein K02A2.6-like [Ostrea edulis]
MCDIKAFDLLSVSKQKQTEIAKYTKAELEALYQIIVDGWPDTRDQAPVSTHSFWNSRDELSVMDGIIFKGMRIVFPPSLRPHMLELIHQSHLGIVKCKQRAREVAYWPGMNSQIEETVCNCSKCATFQNKQTPEPLKPSPVPDPPYQVVGCDLFDFQSKKYLILVDYFSHYVDVVEVKSPSTTSMLEAMKSVFACHGIPRQLRSDNGPQFTSICRVYDIEHNTSSPNFQSSNGEAERAVQTVKRL